ncbi:MAG: DUF222 domain-containing protein [Acidobacteriota bacterium]|nr:DUF222 domain-containing protein [Acidobacteriota bacterium]
MGRGPATAVRHMRAFLAGADPDTVTTAQAAAWLRDCLELERLAAAGKTLLARRAAQATAWVDEGHVNAASWLAEKSKATVGEALSTLATSKALAELPGTEAALRSGRLSAAQAHEVARAAAHDPAAEGELLALAASGSLQELKARAGQVLAQASSAEDEQARERKIHGRRALRHYRDHDGALRIDGRFTAEAGGRLLAALQAETDALFEAARREATHEPVAAYRADALVNLVTGGASVSPATRKPSVRAGTQLTVSVDATALERGHVGPGEVCEIPGVGPVSVEKVRRLLPFADVWTVVRDSVDVLSVCHVGRLVTTHQQKALEQRDRRCVVPGCTVGHGLENHHWPEDFARSGRTSLAELARVCPRHHDMISYRGWRLDGGPGRWRLVGPPGAGENPGPGGGMFEDSG